MQIGKIADGLELRDLCKKFGATKALDNLSLSIPQNAVCGFVGVNGAGKTTTFSLVGGFLRPDSGEMLLNGEPIEKYRGKGGAIGLLPQDMQFFEGRTLERQLGLFAELAGMSRREARIEVARVLEMVALSDRARSLAGSLSRGMKVRLGVAQAFIGSPPLVLLDEPMAGLDPKMRALFRECIDAVRGTTTVVISSHDLTELQNICDYVCMIDSGRLVEQGTLSEMLDTASRVVYQLAGCAEGFSVDALQVSGARFECAGSELIAHYAPGELGLAELNQKVLEALFSHGVGVEQVLHRKSLEERFLTATSPQKEE